MTETNDKLWKRQAAARGEAPDAPAAAEPAPVKKTAKKAAKKG